MRSFSLISLVLAARLAFAAPSSLDSPALDLINVQQAFYNAKIPEALNITFNPSLLLQVIYPQPNGVPVVIKPGQTLPLNLTGVQPQFAIGGITDISDEPSRYVITMFDPDAPEPSAPTLAPIRHFVGSDYVPITPGDFNLALLANQSEAMSVYIQPMPTPGGGAHRFTWLLWKQPKNFDNQTFFTPITQPITDPTPADIAEVSNFDLSAFVKATGLGQHLGGSFAMIGA